MLVDYLGHIANLKKKIGTNTYNEPMFEEKEIACRKVDKFKEVSNDKGEKVISSGVVQCVEPVKVGDYIDDRKVIAVNSMVGLRWNYGIQGVFTVMQIEGLKELQAKLLELSIIAEEEAEKELADIALDLAGKSSLAAPIDLGDLRGELATPIKEDNLSWKVGASLPYTRYQHEGTWFRHPKGGGAKFIERPFQRKCR